MCIRHRECGEGYHSRSREGPLAELTASLEAEYGLWGPRRLIPLRQAPVPPGPA